MFSFESKKRVVRGSLFDNLFAGLGDSLHEFVSGTVKSAVNDVLGWVLKYVVQYLIAAALLIAAVVFLLTAIVEGMVALGLPPWAAHLILAVVAGGGGFLLLKKGGPKRDDDDDGPEYGGGGLTIRVVHPARAARSSRREAPRKRTRTVRRKVLDVHGTRAGSWEVKARRARKPAETFDTKEEAVEAAKKEASKEAPSQVVVRKADGTFQDATTFEAEKKKDSGKKE